MRSFRILSPRLKWSTALVVIVLASAVSARAQTPNTVGSNVNVLNLLSPFLMLNSTAIGQSTLQVNLSQAIAINNGANATRQGLAISDINLLSGASNTVAGLAGTFGPAANLAGGLGVQNSGLTGVPVGVTVQQPVGGYGSLLGPIYQTGVAGGLGGPLGNTVKLLTSAYNFTSSDLGVAKNYFANGNYANPGGAAVAPAGFTLPTFNGLPNNINSVYDLAYGVTNTQTGPTINGQNVYGDSRPGQVSTQINVFYEAAFNGITTNPSFPSGHTNYAYTDSILLGMLVPQLYQSMLSRASEYATSRIVVGVHYPLDIIASRSFASYDLAQAFTNPAYINNAAMTGPVTVTASGATGTAINLPGLFTAAQSELNNYLSTQCGASVASCASSVANTTNNPYVPSAANQATYTSNLTYGLPTLTFAQAPREAAPAGGPDASILLATVYGGSTSAAKVIAPNGGTLGNLQTGTINQIIVNTETNALAAFYGTSLSYWSRIDLYSAIGYFQNVSGVLALAPSDQVNTNVTIAGATTNVNGDVVPAGVLGGAGTINGNVTVNSGGTLAAGVPNAGGFVGTPGTMTINGNVAFNAGSAYLVVFAPATTGSVTNVKGSATIGSNVQEQTFFASGIYTIGTKVPILTTTAGLSGTFSSVAVSSNGGFNVVPKLSFDANNAYVTLMQASLPALPAGSPSNATGLASTLNNYIAGGGVLPNGLQNLFLLSPAAYGNTLNQIGSQLGSASTQSSTATMNNFMGLLFDFSRGGNGTSTGGALGFAPDAQPTPEVASAYAALTPKDVIVYKAPPMLDPHWSLWGSGFGASTRLGGDVTTGSQGLTAQNYGLAAGANYRINPDATAGFALAGGGTSFSLDNGFGSGRSDYFLASGNAKLSLGQAYLAGAIVGGAHGVTTNRTVILGAAVDNLAASYTMPVVGGRLEGGYRFATPFLGLTPYAALQSQAAFVPAYTETSTAGTGAANAVAATTATSTRSELGFWADASWNNLTWRGRLAWAHDYNTDATVNAALVAVPGTSFTIAGARRPADAALATSIVEWPILRNVLLSGKVEGEFGSGLTSLSGTGKIRWVW